MNAIDFVHGQLTTTPALPKFKAGDNITVNYKIVEGSKERIQSFKGDVIKRQGQGEARHNRKVFQDSSFGIHLFQSFFSCLTPDINRVCQLPANSSKIGTKVPTFLGGPASNGQ